MCAAADWYFYLVGSPDYKSNASDVGITLDNIHARAANPWRRLVSAITNRWGTLSKFQLFKIRCSNFRAAAVAIAQTSLTGRVHSPSLFFLWRYRRAANMFGLALRNEKKPYIRQLTESKNSTKNIQDTPSATSIFSTTAAQQSYATARELLQSCTALHPRLADMIGSSTC